jgi:Domain of unknown function (DUF4350)
MNSSQTRIRCLVLVLLAVVAATLWFRLMEPYYKQVDTGWGLKALRNPYHGAQLYLQSSGVAVYTTQKLEQIETISTDKTLFISHAGQVVSHKQVEQLMDWMREGGHIIIAAHHEENGDPLLSHFSVEKLESDKDEIIKAIQGIKEQLDKQEKEPDIAGEAQNADSIEVEPILTTLSFSDIDHEFAVDFSSSAGLLHPYINGENQDEYAELEDNDYKPIYWEYDDNGLQFLQFNVGYGLLTVIGSDNIWENSGIQQYDHAYLLTILTENSEQLVVLYGSLMPHIFVLIWKNAPELVLSAALLLILCLWFAGQRFGSVLAIKSDQRRSFNEHLLASGDFFWRIDQQSLLIQSLRDDMLKTIEKNTASGITGNEHKVCDYLQQRTPYTKEQIHTALYEPTHYKERDFTALVRLLQDLRQKL